MTNPRLFLFSGGPGSGKTTTLNELARLGYRVAPEVARQIIREQVQAGGSALPWADRQAFTDLMLQRSIESYLEHASATTLVFSDRGIPDTLGYARLIGLPDQAVIEQACHQYRCAPLVFVAPPWEEIYTTDSERKQDFAEAVATYGLTVEVYRDCGYEVAVLPKVSPAERASFVLSRTSDSIG